MRRPGRSALLGVLGVVALVLAGCASGTAAPGGTAEQGYLAGDGTTTVVAAADREPAPGLAGTTLDGASFDLSALRGKVVVLNVWASWCPPCRAESPMLQAVATDLRADGVEFVGIATRDGDGTAARAFAENVGLTYPSVLDPDGVALLAFRETLPPQAIPSTLVIDRQGRIAGRVIGPTTEPRLRALIAPVLAEPAS